MGERITGKKDGPCLINEGPPPPPPPPQCLPNSQNM